MNVAFKTPNEIGKMFPFKDKVTDPILQSLVVYRIKCKTCNAEYIGKTERILIHRIKEHKKNGALHDHIIENPSHAIDFDNVEILDKADSDYKIRLKEMLQIRKHNPILNTQLANDKNGFNPTLKTLIIARH
jgi:hypothetical protein